MFLHNFFHKCKFCIVWNGFMVKIILITQNICFGAIRNGNKSNCVLQAWTEACYQIFGSWEVQTMWNS